MNFHKNDENNCTTRIRKENYHMNIFESFAGLMEGFKAKAMQKFLQNLMTSQAQRGWYKRFSGKSKCFKKNKRKGL